jgi:uncharacterized protein (DUF2062 family)
MDELLYWADHLVTVSTPTATLDPMSARVGRRTRSGWYVSFPLRWLALSVAALVALALGALAAFVSYVGGHPAAAAIEAAQFVGMFLAAGLGTYWFCRWLARRGTQPPPEA